MGNMKQIKYSVWCILYISMSVENRKFNVYYMNMVAIIFFAIPKLWPEIKMQMGQPF